MKELFTVKELLDIEIWRLTDISQTSKFTCIWLQKFKNRILKANKEKEEKPECFCTINRRKVYKTQFYIWYDKNYLPK